MKKNKNTTRKNKKTSKKKIRDNIIGTDEGCLMENIEEEEEELCSWTSGEDGNLMDGGKVISQWGF